MDRRRNQRRKNWWDAGIATTLETGGYITIIGKQRESERGR